MGSVKHCVIYISLPSEENAGVPSSASVLSPEAMSRGTLHLPLSSFSLTKMSPALAPVIPLISSPCASLRVELK